MARTRNSGWTVTTSHSAGEGGYRCWELARPGDRTASVRVCGHVWHERGADRAAFDSSKPAGIGSTPAVRAAILAFEKQRRGGKRNPTGTLRGKGKRQWEHVYESQRSRGLPPARAAASAWSTVKKGYRKTGGRWRKRNGSSWDPKTATYARLIKEVKLSIMVARENRAKGRHADAAEELTFARRWAVMAKDRAETFQQKTAAQRLIGEIDERLRDASSTPDGLEHRARKAAKKAGHAIATGAKKAYHGAKKMLGLRNHGRGSGQVGPSTPSSVTRNPSKTALHKLSNPRSKAWN